MKNDLLTNYIESQQYKSLLSRLDNHPIYSELGNAKNLKIFMQHHVYAVWDFMSLIKALQNHIAPTTLPWQPPENPDFANLINQLVLEEESDQALVNTHGRKHTSHFEFYLQAMTEAGANIDPILQFLDTVNNQSIEIGMQSDNVPSSAKRFMNFTFDIISRNKPHQLATLLAYGRETLVPNLFQCIQNGLQLTSNTAPSLHAYLDRHIQLDKHKHGPITVSLVHELCHGSTKKLNEAIDIAEQAVNSRLEFWDGIHEAILS